MTTTHKFPSLATALVQDVLEAGVGHLVAPAHVEVLERGAHGLDAGPRDAGAGQVEIAQAGAALAQQAVEPPVRDLEAGTEVHLAQVGVVAAAQPQQVAQSHVGRVLAHVQVEMFQAGAGLGWKFMS